MKVVQIAAIFVAAASLSACVAPTPDAFKISQEQSSDGVSTPLFTKRLANVTFHPNGWKYQGGVFYDGWGDGRKHVEKRLGADYAQILVEEAAKSGIFPASAPEALTMKVTLIAFKQQSSVGAWEEERKPLTSGAVLTTNVTFRYDLLDNNEVVASWTVSSQAASNSLAPIARVYESTDTALKRNARSIPLKIIADLSPANAERAKQSLALIGSEVDNTRTIAGSIVRGTGLAVIGTGKLAQATLSSVGAGSGATYVPPSAYGPASINALHSQSMTNIQAITQQNKANAQIIANSQAPALTRNSYDSSPQRSSGRTRESELETKSGQGSSKNNSQLAQGQTRVTSNSGSGSNAGSGSNSSSDRPVSVSSAAENPPTSGSASHNIRSGSPNADRTSADAGLKGGSNLSSTTTERQATDPAAKDRDVVESNPYERYKESAKSWGEQHPGNGWLASAGVGNSREDACAVVSARQAQWIAKDESTGIVTVSDRTGCICGSYREFANQTFTTAQWKCAAYHKVRNTGKKAGGMTK